MYTLISRTTVLNVLSRHLGKVNDTQPLKLPLFRLTFHAASLPCAIPSPFAGELGVNCAVAGLRV